MIGASVGTGGSNRPDDVRTIQAALNDVEVEDGGPDPLLAVDGIAGRLTCAAILKYQQDHVRVTDSRVDPGGATLASLNGEGTESKKAKGSASQGRRHRRLRLPPNTDLVKEIELLVPKVRRVIAAAQFHIASAGPFVVSKKILNPDGPFNETARRSLHLLDVSFSLSKFHDPLPAYNSIRRVFFNMNVALNRSFETDPRVAAVLFVSNSDVVLDDSALAYTSSGGAFAKATETFADGSLVNRIYLCNSLIPMGEMTRIMTMVHELAHYVSGQPFDIDDFVNGDMRFQQDRPKFDRLKPEKKIRNAENYAFFALTCAFPEVFKE